MKKKNTLSKVKTRKKDQITPIAIVGMAGILPNAENLSQYWDNILNEVNCISEVPPSRWNVDEYFEYVVDRLFMALGNYKKINKSGDHKWSNLEMCVHFSGQPDEVGFIMLHVDINQHSPSLVGSVINVLHALKERNLTSSVNYLKENYQTMKS